MHSSADEFVKEATVALTVGKSRAVILFWQIAILAANASEMMVAVFVMMFVGILRAVAVRALRSYLLRGNRSSSIKGEASLPRSDRDGFSRRRIADR
ncbi:hypothetical protein GGD63_004745 [Bradyrhizobium sp. cir1]|uniref:hypothetical protein n=1 Tax=Bradyrhizobium sp. cir1 TaxID=1445730 RepID=UPI00160608DB|nr:hypothetical protein [Bradyrhizobium sp. cir1]MBB4371944.1 hypothetical protein [Bradyrhizobium sp. cir1]